MNKKTLAKVTGTAAASFLIAGTTAFTAFAAMPQGTVVIGNKAYDLDYANDPKNEDEIYKAMQNANFEVYVKDFEGNWIINETEEKLDDIAKIPAVEYKDAKGKVTEYHAKDGDKKDKNDDNAEVSIKSVTPLNLKQVKIEFGEKITDGDKIDDIEDEDNYTIENDERDELKNIVDKVEMDESGEFAILTFSDKENFDKDGRYKRPTESDKGIVNQEKYFITFDENITGKEVEKEVKFKDGDRPKVEGIEVIGNDTIKVKFSEPIRPNYTDNGKSFLDDKCFKIDNDNISVNEAELVNDNKEVNIKLGSTLNKADKLKVEVKGTVEDYAGYGVVSVEETLDVKEDTAKPEVVGYKKVKKGEVTLIFNRDIRFKGTDDKVNPKDAFDKNGDIKEWKDIDSSIKDGMDEYYHTNETNKAYAAKIDGKELTLYFEDEKGLAPGTNYINIKSGELETYWEKENDKILHRVERDEDKTPPEVKKVEQDEDVANKIKVKFNEELKVKEAEDKDHYELKDKDGDKWSIKKAEYKNDDKEVVIYTTKDLDSGDYELTIKDVEDKAGNVIKKVTKKFSATEKDARVENDLSINLYNPGENDQKIVVDFDTKMKTGDNKNSITDISKYTLVAKQGEKTVAAFDNKKSAIQIEDMYNRKIKAVNDDHKVEITIPYKDGKDDAYDFSKYYKKTDGSYVKVSEYNETDHGEVERKDGKKCEYYYINDTAFDTLELQIGKVADTDNNVNATVLAKAVDGAETVDVDSSKGNKLVRAISPDKVQVTFKDKLNLKNEDLKVWAIDVDKMMEDENKKGKSNFDKKAIIDGIEDGTISVDEKYKTDVKVSRWYKDTNDDGNTYVDMTLDKNQDGSQKNKFDDSDYDHVLNYDGTFDGKIVFLEVKQGESKNDYDAKLTPGFHRVLDNIAPALVDNGKREKKYRYAGMERASEKSTDGNITYVDANGFGTGNKEIEYNDEAVEFFAFGEKGSYTGLGAIVLTFEENLDPASVRKDTFTLDTDGDFKKVKVIDEYVANGNKIVIEVEGLETLNKDNNSDKKDIEFGEGFDLHQNAPIRDASGDQYVRGLGNQVEGIKTEIGGFKKLSAEKVNDLLKDGKVKTAISEADAAKAKADAIKDANDAIAKLPAADEITKAGTEEGATSLADAKTAVEAVEGKVTAATKLGATKQDGEGKDIDTTKLTAVKARIAELADKLPTASNVTINGTVKVGQQLTGNYDYADADTDAEAGSTFRWLVADTADGAYTAIAGANEKTFTVTVDQIGKFIKFEVTPTNANGQGNAALSNATTQVLSNDTALTAKGTEVTVDSSAHTITDAATNLTAGTTDASTLLGYLIAPQGGSVKVFDKAGTTEKTGTTKLASDDIVKVTAADGTTQDYKISFGE